MLSEGLYWTRDKQDKLKLDKLKQEIHLETGMIGM